MPGLLRIHLPDELDQHGHDAPQSLLARIELLASPRSFADIDLPQHGGRSGEFSPGEKARFYRLARRSATECAAALDMCRILDLGEGAILDVGDELLRRFVSMLTKMAMQTAPGLLD